ncbi:MAG TPA: recombinase family protein [Streptosporangiaceae bacterium]|jgi:hypothetical protein
MAAQAQLEGRYLGGRPPYGYRLVDAGPHPNPAKAADGRRLHKLATDELAAAVVRRIFAMFVAGYGIFAIAEILTAERIPSPSAHDRARNSHRCGLAWSKSAVRAILGNPRYTGRQVWNRQRKDEVLIDVHDVALGHTTKMRWNEDSKWIYSEQVVHSAVIDDQTFAQARLAAKNARQVERRPRTSPRPYPLRGLLFCGICQRRMQGTWNNDQAYYRCTYPREYAQTNQVRHPRTVYLREAEILPGLDGWLGHELDPARLPATLAGLQAAALEDTAPPEVAGLREQLAGLNRKLTSYRAALDSGADPAVVSQWITETQASKLAAEIRLRALDAAASGAPALMTKEEITAMVTTITDVITVLRTADPADKAELYAQLGLADLPAGSENSIRPLRTRTDMYERVVSEGDLNT